MLLAHKKYLCGAKLIISKEIYWYQWSRESASFGSARCDEVIGPVADYGTLIDPPVLLRAALARRGAAMPTPSSITFDRQLALDLGAIPERFTSQYEDQALTSKLMLAAAAVVLDAPLIRYRQHPESLTHRLVSSGEYRPGRPHAAYFDYLRWLREYIAEYVPHFTEFDPAGSWTALVMASCARRLPAAAVSRRIALQLDAFEGAMGGPPDYVDGHRHIHQLPQIRSALLEELTRRYGRSLPWIRVSRPAPGSGFKGRVKK